MRPIPLVSGRKADRGDTPSAAKHGLQPRNVYFGVLDGHLSLSPLVSADADLLKGATPAEIHATLLDCATRGTLTIVDLLDSVPWFRGGADWLAWRSWLCALYGLPMTPAELAVYRQCTGRRYPPTAQASEAWLIAGRRAKKSAVSALVGVWHGAFRDHTQALAPGERARIPIIAKSVDEAGQIRAYVVALLRSSPVLECLLEGAPIAETVKLTTRCDFRIVAMSLTAGRSRCVPAALLDETAFWRSDESATPDRDVIRGITPGMTTVDRPLLLGLSSPYAKRGVLYEAYRDHYGREDDPVLVWKAATVRMHDTPQVRVVVAAEHAKDPISARAEYGSPDGSTIDFRDDVTGYITDTLLDAVIVPKRTELAPGLQRYLAFADPSGGASDSFALAIGHFEHRLDDLGKPMKGKGKAVLDFLREWPAPFDPAVVTAEAAADLRRYGLKSVRGDYYGGEWPRSKFREHGIAYDVSELPKGRIYLEALPLLTSGHLADAHAELLDHDKLRRQLAGLERRTGSQGREIVDHPDGQHDDLANAAMGVLWMADEARRSLPPKPPRPNPRDEIEADRRHLHDTLRQRLAKAAEQQRGGEWVG